MQKTNWKKYRPDKNSDEYLEKLRYTNESLADCKIRLQGIREKKLAKTLKVVI